MACDLCDDTGWVCEDHADRPLKGDSNRADACSFGAGMPCPRCNRDNRHVAHVPRLPVGMRVALDRRHGATSPGAIEKKIAPPSRTTTGPVWEETANPTHHAGPPNSRLS